MKKNQKYLKITLSFIAVLFILLAIFLYWLYSGTLTPTKNKILNSLPFPMAFVNGQAISMSQFTFRYNLSNEVLNPAFNLQKESSIKNSVYNTLIQEAKINQIARANGVFVGSKEIDDTYKEQESKSDLENDKSFDELLKIYHFDKHTYKNAVIKPELLLNALKIWFNSQKELNKILYEQANKVSQKISNGEDFKLLAKNYSQEEVEKSIEGDLGYLDISEILPELREQVSTIQTGEYKVIPSRFGLHIIKLEEKSGNKIHLRQIFLNGTSFENWYLIESKKIKIIKLLNI